MPVSWRDAIKISLPAISGTLLAALAFILMRVSAIYESWPLLFVSFGLMVWGIVMLFTGSWRSRRKPELES